MTSDRIYRKHLDSIVVIKMKGAGTQFDPEIAEAMLDLIKTEKIKLNYSDLLGQIGLAEHGGHIPHIAVCQRAIGGVEGADDDQRVEGQHHEGVDEHTDHRHNALIVRGLDVRLRVGVGLSLIHI